MLKFSNRHMFSGAVLAGGENKRFPVLKGFLRTNGITIIEKNISLIQTICNEVFISINTPESYFKFQVNMFGDIFPSMGPMSGIYSSLLNAKHDNLLIIACDMPFLNLNILSFIIKKHLEKTNSISYDATIPIYNNQPQPLCGVYCKTAIPSLEEHLIKGRNSMHLFLREIKTNYINDVEIKDIDPSGNSFININTIEDYETVRGWESEFAVTCNQLSVFLK